MHNNSSLPANSKSPGLDGMLDHAKLSELIHSVGHEINNPLTAIVSLSTVMERYAADTLAASLSASEDLRHTLATVSQHSQTIHHEAWKIATLIRQLVLILSERKIEVSVLDPQQELESISRVIAREKPGTHISLSADLDYPDLHINRAQFTETCINLINFIHARKRAESQSVHLQVENDSGSLRISIRSSQQYPRLKDIEDPLAPFATKGLNSVELGLTLTAANSVCQRYHGSLEISEDYDNAEYELCTALVFLPRNRSITSTVPLTEKPIAVAPSAKRSTASHVRLMRVLIIDDETVVASAIEKLLCAAFDASYRIECHRAQGVEAIELLAEGGEYTAILCDINLEQTSGLEIYNQVHGRFPQLCRRFAFLTGQKSNAALEQKVQQLNLPLIYKPFDARQLCGLIADLVAAEP